jgi:hypothetical protein
VISGEVDQTSNVTGDIPVVDTGSATGEESKAASSTSSSTMDDQVMMRKEISSLYQY